MSCPPNSNSRNFNVSAGSLPEGYCPVSYQQLLSDIAARLIVTSPLNNSSFATGSSSPSSNVGPWLKNCERWFIFDDATGTYIPIYKGGFDSMQYLQSSANFVVPDGIFKLKIEAFGGGGGGASWNGANASAAGGGGAYGASVVAVTPGQVIAYVIGTGGAGGVGAGNAPGVDGGDTTILGMTAGGGKAGLSPASVPAGGAGGIATGFIVNLSGQYGQADITNGSTIVPGGGDAGGWGGKGGNAAKNLDNRGRNGTAPGGGGAAGQNATDATSGAGANGAILIEY